MTDIVKTDPKLEARRDEVLDAIGRGMGIKTTIARKLKINRDTLTRWIEQDEEIRAAFEDAVEILLDTAEHKLIENMLAGDMKAIRYLLETKGKSRGYGQPKRLEVLTAQMSSDERRARFERVARAFGYEVPETGVAGVIDVTAEEGGDE